MRNLTMEDFVLIWIKSNNGITASQLVDKLREKFGNEFLPTRIALMAIKYVLTEYSENIESIMGYLYWRENNETHSI